MGTHPIFESDFDCLTDMTEFKRRVVPLIFTIIVIMIFGLNKWSSTSGNESQNFRSQISRHEKYARRLSEKCGHVRFRAPPRFSFAARRSRLARLFVNEENHLVICSKNSQMFDSHVVIQNGTRMKLFFNDLSTYSELNQRIILKHYNRVLVVSDPINDVISNFRHQKSSQSLAYHIRSNLNYFHSTIFETCLPCDIRYRYVLQPGLGPLNDSYLSVVNNFEPHIRPDDLALNKKLFSSLSTELQELFYSRFASDYEFFNLTQY